MDIAKKYLLISSIYLFVSCIENENREMFAFLEKFNEDNNIYFEVEINQNDLLLRSDDYGHTYITYSKKGDSLIFAHEHWKYAIITKESMEVQTYEGRIYVGNRISIKKKDENWDGYFRRKLKALE